MAGPEYEKYQHHIDVLGKSFTNIPHDTVTMSRNTIRVSNSLDPDQAQQNVGPDLGPNCLQRLSADDTGS